MGQIEALSGEPVARAEFIRAMRRVASSVTVVTTGGPAGRHGATVSAFCSVSADPPSALICLRADSRIAGLVAANGRFCINVLPCSRQDIADRFAGCHDDRVTDRFEGIEHARAPGLIPVIAGSTALSCVLRETVDFGSHRVFIGHVVDVSAGTSDPLAYLDGAYHRVVPRLPVPPSAGKTQGGRQNAAD